MSVERQTAEEQFSENIAHLKLNSVVNPVGRGSNKPFLYFGYLYAPDGEALVLHEI